MSEPLPRIDLASLAPADAVRAVDAALTAHGFFVLAGHGVAPAVVDAAFDAARRFFALPPAAQAPCHVDRRRARDGGAAFKRGHDPLGWQALDPARPPDLKESFYLGVESQAPNAWPDAARVPGFRAAVEAYAAALQALSTRLMRLFEAALALPPGAFDPLMRDPVCTTRLLHYPAPAAGAAALTGQLGCGAHTDWGALTLLAQDDAGGLQVRRRGGDGRACRGVGDGRDGGRTTAGDGSGDDAGWIDVPPQAGTFVVNVGDLTQRWTNDRWPSTPHRVQPMRAGRERFSIAYFFDMDADARIEPLSACVSATNPSRYASLTAGEHLAAMYRATTVGAAAATAAAGARTPR